MTHLVGYPHQLKEHRGSKSRGHTASSVSFMLLNFAVNSKERNSDRRYQGHERFAADVYWKLLEQKVDAGGGIHLRSTNALEQELQSELNESRVVELAVHNSEARVIGCRYSQTGVIAARGVRWAKLDAIERVEELCPELQAKLILRAKVRRLKQGEVRVIDPCPTHCGIHARLVAEVPSGQRKSATRRCEAVRVEPKETGRRGRLRYALVASWYNIRAQGKVLREASA